MARSKREYPYPKLTLAEKQLVYDFLCACREDFHNGQTKTKLMYKLCKEEWVFKNITYFTHCVSAVDYANSKVRLPTAKVPS